jgi:hypothetical protein
MANLLRLLRRRKTGPRSALIERAIFDSSLVDGVIADGAINDGATVDGTIIGSTTRDDKRKIRPIVATNRPYAQTLAVRYRW